MTLRLEDFRNPMFDKQRIVKRQVPARPGVRVEEDDDEEFEEFAAGREPKRRTEAAIEGTTFTDEYIEVGFTYYVADGLLTVVNTSNQELFKGTIASAAAFEKALKKADAKQRRLYASPPKAVAKRRR